MSATVRKIRFTLNGTAVDVTVATHESLVEVLRDRFDLFGARESCGQGLCGCCTVLIDGQAVSSCLYLATVFADGAELANKLRAWHVTVSSIRCSRRSLQQGRSSAASVRRVSS